jgi:TrmH family RNA methyltransferase
MSTEQHITSPQNEHVKELVELRKDGEVRRERGEFFLEGRRGVAAALGASHVEIREVIHCPNLMENETLVKAARERNVPLVKVSKDVFRKIADVVTPQGIAAVVKMPQYTLAQVLEADEAPLIVVACGLQDPGNLGTIIRSCEAAGATGLVALEGTADFFNAKVVRSTAAGLLTLPLVRMKAAAFITDAMARNVRLVATAASEGVSYRTFDWKRRPIALCIGSEGEGLPEAMEIACQERVTIPMRGQAESLNAAVAASILLFEAQAG